MLDNQLKILMYSALRQSAAARGIGFVKFKANYQPTQQGRQDDPTVYMFKAGDHRYGSRKVDEHFDVPTNAIVRTEKQVIETTFKFAATQNVDPANIAQFTHNDLLKITASILQSDDTIKFLFKNGAQVLRITEISNLPVENDQGNFEDNPAFDVIITHTDTFIDGVPVIDKFELSMYRV